MKWLCVILLVILLTNCVLSQEILDAAKDSVLIDEILVESNRLKMTKELAPNKIQLFDEGFISSINGQKLSDLLDQSNSVFVKDYGFNSGIKVMSLNATQSEHTLILLDGVRLNSKQNAQVDLSLYELDNISKIEVSSGGSSAMYGSEAIGGIINIKTRDIDSSKPFEILFESIFGSYGLSKYYGRFSHQLKLKRNKTFSYYLSYSDERARNNFDYVYRDGSYDIPKERENADFNTQSFNLNANFLSGKSSAMKLFTLYSHFERGVPGIESGYSAGTARQIDYNSFTSISYNKSLSKKLNFTADFNYKYSLQKYFDTATYNLSVKLNSFYKLNSFTNNAAIEFTAGNEFNVLSGYEISYNNMFSNDTEEGKLIQGALFSTAKYELNQKIVSKITFYPSLRYDYFSNLSQKNVFTGKIGINIKPLAKHDLSLKSSFGNNFGAPTFNELYWKDVGNKNLKPERSVSFDAGAFYKFNLLFVNELEISYFNINTTDRIVWTPVSANIWHPVNVGKVKSEGIDINLISGLNLNRKLNISFRINYSFGTAVKKNEDYPGDPSYNKQQIYLPKEMLKSSFMLNYLPTSKLVKYVSFNLFYRYTTRRYSDFENTQFAPRYDILDGNIGIGLRINYIDAAVKFIINNILNENYQVVTGFPMPLRNYKFEISFNY